MEQHELSRETQISNGIKLERNRNSVPIYIYIYIKDQASEYLEFKQLGKTKNQMVAEVHIIEI